MLAGRSAAALKWRFPATGARRRNICASISARFNCTGCSALPPDNVSLQENVFRAGVNYPFRLGQISSRIHRRFRPASLRLRYAISSCAGRCVEFYAKGKRAAGMSCVETYEHTRSCSTNKALGDFSADRRRLPFHSRSADAVRGDGLPFADRRLLLIFAWMQNRNTPALAFWGTGYLLGACAAALLASPGLFPNAWSVVRRQCAACALME
jgi:hypothetical protein